MTQDEKVKLYDQTVQRYLNYFDRRMSEPVHVSVVPPQSIETKGTEPAGTESYVPESPPGEIEADIWESVLGTMETRAKQLIKKSKSK